MGIVIPNLLEYRESMVVLDIKQENFDLTIVDDKVTEPQLQELRDDDIPFEVASSKGL